MNKSCNFGYIYVLALRENRLYVGETNNLKRRLREHLTGLYYDIKKRKWVSGGSEMTRTYKPKRIASLYRPNLSFEEYSTLVKGCSSYKDLNKSLKEHREKEERNLTFHYATISGRHMVRGSKWCSVSKGIPLELLEGFTKERPNCSCDLPAEKITLTSGIEKWVCGAYQIHNSFDFKLVSSTSGLLLMLEDGLNIPVGLCCDYNKPNKPNKSNNQS